MSAVQAERLQASCRRPFAITSEGAIEAARSLWSSDDIFFEARDMREFDPVGNWDAIVFSGVLSYLAVHEAITEVRRYAKALSPEGVVAISTKNGGTSRAIWRALRREFQWIDGILWQQKEPWPSYRIRRGPFRVRVYTLARSRISVNLPSLKS